MVFVNNVDEHYRHSISSGARILEEIFNTEYGERQYSAQDLEGHVWTFSVHVKDVSPISWGGKIANERTESTKK
jgi:uncharacterized glyoxalase superfamily protein PhnB